MEAEEAGVLEEVRAKSVVIKGGGSLAGSRIVLSSGRGFKARRS